LLVTPIGSFQQINFVLSDLQGRKAFYGVRAGPIVAGPAGDCPWAGLTALSSNKFELRPATIALQQSK
jgi:hypothetical protein